MQLWTELFVCQRFTSVQFRLLPSSGTVCSVPTPIRFGLHGQGWVAFGWSWNGIGFFNLKTELLKIMFIQESSWADRGDSTTEPVYQQEQARLEPQVEVKAVKHTNVYVVINRGVFLCLNNLTYCLWHGWILPSIICWDSVWLNRSATG